MRFISEQDRKERAARFLGGVSAQEATEQKQEATPNELGRASLNMLIKAALEIGLALLAIYAALGLHPAEGKSACDDLLARAMVELHRLPKGRGGQVVVLQVLEPGLAELRKRGITPSVPHLERGGFRHAVYGEYLGKWADARSLRHWWERTLGVKAFDFVYEEEGRLHAIEVCLTGSAEWTAQQALKGASVEGIHELIVACERKPFLDATMKAIKAIDELGLYRNKIVGKLLAEFIP